MPALAVVALLASGCGQRVGIVHWEYDCGGGREEQLFTETQVRELDLLFVIDNSISMGDEQQQLRDNFGALMQALRGDDGELPDVHIGVVTTDIGIAPYSDNGCSTHGDDGDLQAGYCGLPYGHSYLVNVAPRGCGISRDEVTGLCTDHACADEHCAHEPETTLVLDAQGCPRCANHAGESLEQAFSCTADVGDNGCGFEQPLEAMRKALDDNPSNDGFLRPYSFLAVVLISDEDDCSAENTTIFSSDTNLESIYGPRASFRCFEYGVTCDDASPLRDTGWHTDCRARESDDASLLLFPLADYVDFLHGLRDPDQLAVAAIGGPQTDDRVEVGRDEYDRPLVLPRCGEPGPNGGGAAPGFRLQEFVRAFNEPADMSWAYTSICEDAYSAALSGLGAAIRQVLDTRCLAVPLDGCTDPGAALGHPGDDETCNDGCRADCEIHDVLDRGTSTESRTELPSCLKVCPAGACPENEEPALAYAGGQPPDVDPQLPVPACWWITYNPQCAMSNGAEVTVSRREEPSQRSFLEVRCLQIPTYETCCFDGVDNDQDCLSDLADPDCADAFEPGSGTDHPH